MNDFINIIELFRGTIFYILIGIAVFLTIIGFSVFVKSREEIKKKSETFKKGKLAEFLENKKLGTDTKTEEIWEKFFDEIEAFKEAEEEFKTLKELKNRFEDFYESFRDLKDEHEIIDDFGKHIGDIYDSWRELFKKTFLSCFIFVIFSGVSVFIMMMPLAIYIGYLTEYLGLSLMIIGLILFLLCAIYSFKSLRYHFYGEIDDYLLSSDDEIETKLNNHFTSFAKKWRRSQALFKELLPQLLQEYPFVGRSYELYKSIRKVIKAS